MPKQTFALERGGPKRLEISWKAFWRDIQITLDGKALGGFESKKQLDAGGRFPLPDGTELHVQFKREGIAGELHVLRNGAPVKLDGEEKKAAGEAPSGGDSIGDQLNKIKTPR